MKKSVIGYLIVILLLLVIFISGTGNPVNSDLTLNSYVQYTNEIPKVFSNQTFAQEKRFHNTTNYYTLELINNEVWLKVIIRLKDNSNIDITGTKEEKVDLIKQKEEWFEPRINNVLDTLSEDDVKEVRRHSDGFGALLSEEGFDKLINNEDVRKIIWPQTGFIGTQNDWLLKNWTFNIIIIFLIVVAFYFVIKNLRNNKK